MGGNPGRLLSTVGLDEAALSEPAGRISFDQFQRLVGGTATALGRADFGMRLAEPKAGPEIMRPLEQLIRNAPSLAEAFEICSTRTDAFSSAIDVTLVDHPTAPLKGLRYEFEINCGIGATQVSELFLRMTDLGTRFLTNGRVRPREIWFAHPPQASREEYRRTFGTDVHFDTAADIIFYDAADMRMAVPGSDPQTFQKEAQRIRKAIPSRMDDRLYRIRSAIRMGLANGQCERADIAEQLNTSIRTLNRHIEKTGQSFGSLKDEIRKQLAMKYLSGSDNSLRRIAHRIGFADVAVLCKASQRWFGQTPATVRRLAKEYRRASLHQAKL
jgi:AraC-like DNA-binding protein